MCIPTSNTIDFLSFIVEVPIIDFRFCYNYKCARNTEESYPCLCIFHEGLTSLKAEYLNYTYSYLLSMQYLELHIDYRDMKTFITHYNHMDGWYYNMLAECLTRLYGLFTKKVKTSGEKRGR